LIHVSIHAPAWGATDSKPILPLANTVSIHAPAWGATFRPPLPHILPSGFNPRARVGRDRNTGSIRQFLRVSIHAPAWGATHRCFLVSSPRLFQSTRPRGARLNVTPQTISRWIKFQSTRPRGARLMSESNAPRKPEFQSTRPRGARPKLMLLRMRRLQVSIHAPAWGATH